jgi:hypothetical protein
VNIIKTTLLALAGGTVFLSGCATTSGAGGMQTATDRAIRNCMFSVAGGAILGAVIGNNTGSGSAGRGAAAGALAGAGACAVFLAVANERDRARMRELEFAALNANQNSRGSFTNTRGEQVNVSTMVEEAPVRASAQGPDYTACRYSSQTIEVSGAGSAAPGQQLWCRLDTGDWEPVNG